jgi:hypothetical protein
VGYSVIAFWVNYSLHQPCGTVHILYEGCWKKGNACKGVAGGDRLNDELLNWRTDKLPLEEFHDWMRLGLRIEVQSQAEMARSNSSFKIYSNAMARMHSTQGPSSCKTDALLFPTQEGQQQ